VLATAYDISGDLRYRDAVLEGINYIFGRNALNQSYVTGYGERASQNQHSRWYARQLNPALPNPPVGTLAGGPNSSIQDPLAQSLLRGCAPQFCYIDDIESWSTNELTINWNAPLAWVAAFVADQGDGAALPAPACSVKYLNHGQWPGHFIAQINITNTGTTTIDGWELAWSFIGDQKIIQLWSGELAQDGARVSVKNLSWNAKIRPNQTVTFGFIATTSGPNPEPSLFTLNGQPCTVA
jgi:endoglucanase